MTANDVDLEVMQSQDGTFRVRTSGLGRFGRPEIEVARVEQTQVTIAGDLLRRLADRLSGRPAYDGQRVSVGDDDLVVELQEGDCSRAPQMSRAFEGRDRTILRVTDAGGATASAALCASARERAEWYLRRGDRSHAMRLLNDALDAACGTATAVRRERSRVRLKLAELVMDREQGWQHFRAALAESAETQVEILGAPASEFFEFDRRHLSTDMRRIASINLGFVPAAEQGEGPRVVPSPIWQRGPGGMAELGMSMVPRRFMHLYWAAETREALEDGRVPELAAYVFESLAVDVAGIARLAFVTAESRETFRINPYSPRGVASPEPVPGYVFLASAVLAHVARLHAAGLDRVETEAAFGLRAHDADANRRAAEKCRQLRVMLARWTQLD